MQCPQCQNEIPDSAKFCLECGSRVSGESTASGVEGFGVEGTIGYGQPTEFGPGAAFAGDEAEQTLDGMPTMVGPGEANAAAAASGAALADRYDLEEEIGRGGFASVWRATDRKLGRTVAIKRLLPQFTELAANAQTLARFRREAQAIACLNHRNIVAVHDCDRDADGDYIVMEYLSLGTLRAYLKEQGGKLELAEAIALVAGIAQGLGSAHKKNLVHRDIKPANILLAREGNELVPKIVDFGLARAGDDSGVSMSGYGMGTPAYMPPEQRRDAKNVNHTADIYALGKVLYELVSGDVPDNVDPEKIPSVVGLQELIYKCLKSQPEDRYFSADELVAELAALTGSRIAAEGPRPAAAASGNTCPACQAGNGEDVRYCESCGAGLTRVCPECERENSVHKEFCGGCGSDVGGFATFSDALQRMMGYADAKRWSRVVEEHELLPAQVRLPGEKGKKLQRDIASLRQQAERQLAEIRDRLQGTGATDEEKKMFIGIIVAAVILGLGFVLFSPMAMKKPPPLPAAPTTAAPAVPAAAPAIDTADTDYAAIKAVIKNVKSKSLKDQRGANAAKAIKMIDEFIIKYPNFPEKEKLVNTKRVLEMYVR